MEKTAKQKYFDKKYAEAPFVECACGCGEKIKSVDKYGRPSTYINGHNRRKYFGDEATPWAREKRYRAKVPQKIADNKRNFYRKRKLKAMKILGNKCVKCGTKHDGKNAPIFEFHHTNPSEKEYGITRILINKAWNETLKELTRCVLVCANCHNKIHGGGEW